MSKNKIHHFELLLDEILQLQYNDLLNIYYGYSVKCAFDSEYANYE